MTKIKNKTVLITGGASGIGKLMSRLSLARKAKVIIWDINTEKEGFNKVYKQGFNIMEAYSGKDIILVDTAMQVRSYYDLNDSTVNELVRDISVILPLKKKSSIKMKDR